MTDTEVMQDTLNRLTAKIERWRQNTWCGIPGGADPISDENIESGTYHDFTFSPELVEWFNSPDGRMRRSWGENVVPVANCGTSFCVAGDVCVTNGYTFVAMVGSIHAGAVVKTDELDETLRMSRFNLAGDVKYDPATVAATILDISRGDANVLFHQSRSLAEIWGVAYALTDGEITLPETLPDTTKRDFDGDEVPDAGTATAIETRRKIFEALREIDGKRESWDVIAERELAKLGAVEA